MYAAGAHLVALVHFVFVALAVLGSFLLLLEPRWLWLQIPIALWSAAVFLFDWRCTLTPLENVLRARAGRAGYRRGFIEHYLGCPQGMSRRAKSAVGVGLLLGNAALMAAFGMRT